ncbi:hypothetical protein C8R44DRAFT_795007 [Mycena epipterygia]|nr:hypothetical protein C8R44DRAFT_795007 [Mycena epipterygia]
MLFQSTLAVFLIYYSSCVSSRLFAAGSDIPPRFSAALPSPDKLTDSPTRASTAGLPDTTPHLIFSVPPFPLSHGEPTRPHTAIQLDNTSLSPGSAPEPQHTRAGAGKRPHRPKEPTPLIVATIALVALFLFAVVLGFLKFLHSYWITPRFDPSAADLDRQRVEREVLRAEHELALGGEGLSCPPPPPYFPRPPSYVDEPSPRKEIFAQSPRILVTPCPSPGIYLDSPWREDADRERCVGARRQSSFT